MKEISNNLYYDDSHPGVTLGAAVLPLGTLYIDAPFRVEDSRSWRSAVQELSQAPLRSLVNLDSHYDRTLGARNMDTSLIGQEKMAEVLRNRPVNSRAQNSDSGSDWEVFSQSGPLRWVIPEVTFQERMYLHWSDDPVILEHRPGPASGATWVIFPQAKTVFVGDAVVPSQPPFLAFARIADWVENLQLLLSPEFEDFNLISGRGGLVSLAEVQQEIDFLNAAQEGLYKLRGQTDFQPGINELAQSLAQKGKGGSFHDTKYQRRLDFGLKHNFIRQFRSPAEAIEE